MRVLGIETSCDETGVAIYDTERGLVADALYSQVTIVGNTPTGVGKAPNGGAALSIFVS